MSIAHRFLLNLFFVAAFCSSASAQLQPGDIVIIGVQSDGTDRFAWVPLVDLTPGQALYFTDAGWNAEAQAFQRQVNAAKTPSTTSPSGGAIRYTVPPGGLSAGTVVEVVVESRNTGEPGGYTLVVTGASAEDFSAANDTDVVGDQGVSIATTGDQLLILTGSLLEPAFIFGINTGANQWDLGSTTAQHSSDLPPNLMEGLSAIAIGAGPDAGNEVDNGRYIGPTAGTPAILLSQITNPSYWETSDTDLDDLIRGILAFNLVSSDPVTISLDTIFVAPGDTTRMPITVVNTTNRQVGFLQFRVVLAGPAAFAQIPVSGICADLDIELITDADESLTVSITAQTGGPPIIKADTTDIIGYLHLIPAHEGLNKTVGVHFPEDIIMRDTGGSSLTTERTEGLVQIGIRGDINIDHRVNILDATGLVYRLIHNTLWAPGTIRYQMADANADGSVNIVDIIGIVRTILGLPFTPVQTRMLPATSAVAHLQVRPAGVDRQSNLSLSIETDRPLGGLYATFTFDPSRLHVGSPAWSRPSEDLILESTVQENRLHVLAISPSLSLSSGVDMGVRMHLPVHLLSDNGGDLTLTELTLIDAGGQTVPVQLHEAHQTIRSEKQVPKAFALQPNTPNPFNPETRITYQVPSPAQVTLTVYNLLGQEVIKLVDRRHAAGRYEVLWNARNRAGEAVASGVYVYRMTSDTGFVETRRMTMLK